LLNIYLGTTLKPKKEEVIHWVRESVRNILLEEDVFFNVILKDFEEAEDQNSDQRQDGVDSEDELVFEDDNENQDDEMHDIEL